MGLLDGLETMGLGHLEGGSLFGDAKKEGSKESGKPAGPTEVDVLLDKKQKCPVCDHEFTNKSLKAGKVKLLGQDQDLRARYDIVDPGKYDVIACPACGYAALSSYWPNILNAQAKKIRETISPSYKSKPEESPVYSYEYACERYKLTLMNAVVKQAKDSEKAYICLKWGWLLRGQAESLDKGDPGYAQKLAKINAEEEECMKNAFEGFYKAISIEGFPMARMDEQTINFLIAVLGTRFGRFDIAGKIIGNLIASQGTNPRLREKSLDLREEIKKKLKENRS